MKSNFLSVVLRKIGLTFTPRYAMKGHRKYFIGLTVALMALTMGSIIFHFSDSSSLSVKNIAPTEHTATLLLDGNILIAGGAEGIFIKGAAGSYSPAYRALASAEMYNSTLGTWTDTLSLNDARYDHSATLLANGKVLVAGGQRGINLAGVEFYDPRTKRWTTSSAMNSQNVQFAGRQRSDNALASAEIYDPTSEKWVMTNAMNYPRWNHTATLLSNGKVLAVGGQDGDNPINTLASAELYDPSADMWTMTGAMNVARRDFTATLLSNGKVLVVGGVALNDELSSAELYDPATGTWTMTGQLNNERRLHTATLLSNGKVLVIGGQHGTNVLLSAELYDPATGYWTMTGAMSDARAVHTATLLSNGKVLVAGGGGDQKSHGRLSSTEVYNPITETWSVAGNLNNGRNYHTATLLPNGNVLVAGGLGGDSQRTSLENILRSISSIFQFISGSPRPPDSIEMPLTRSELYDPATGMWSSLSD